MLTSDGCRIRRGRFLETLGLDDGVAIVNDPSHVHYLCGHYASPNTLNWSAHNWLVLWPTGESLLLVDDWQGEAARQSFADRVEVAPWYDCTGPAPNRMRLMNDFLAAHLKRRLPHDVRLACEMQRFPEGAMRALAKAGLQTPVADATPALERIRRAKDPDELALIGRSIAMGEAIHAASREWVEPGMTEWELYTLIHNEALETGEGEIVMRCDVEGSPRLGRAPRLQETLVEGGLVILDLFPLLLGYRADFTNTLSVGGEPSKRQQEMFVLCQEAMAEGERTLRPGARACDVYQAVRGVFARAGQAELFKIHAGHAIGLDHPEAPFFTPGDEETLVEGAVVTLEPDLNDPDAGRMRFENNYLITADRSVKLTNHEIGLV